ncbi:hypothetical protein QAD02_012868 [Eretmocerus hayati]|uniref:Uncharacterized protein n=1 Tax=Eretmocerus hayati TaxID=131215 RepID=A0ACC2P2N4_9HYME|nr:hypothetical protein QAD02_012868 [Eretmocerus hayati]
MEIERDPYADKTALRIFNKRKARGRVGIDALYSLLYLHTTQEHGQFLTLFQRMAHTVISTGLERKDWRERLRVGNDNHQHLPWRAAVEILGHGDWALWEQEAMHDRDA